MLVNKELFRYRPDIDGLRAVAVLSVIFYHFNKNLLPGGFMGVDIFFVISGYVVTATIFRYQSNNLKKYLLTFYARRIKRILPNLIVVIVFFSVISFLFIPPINAGGIIKSGMYSLLGVSNFYFVFEDFDYFGIGSQSNPFTHTWSLGVEEQFYLIYPFVIYLIFTHFKKSHLTGLLILIGLGLLSAVYSGYSFYSDPVYAYYYMPSRFWELAAGGALFIAQAGGYRIDKDLSYKWATIWQMIAVIFVAYGLFFSSGSVGFPFPGAVPIVAGTSIIIFVGNAENNPISKILSLGPFVYIGILSYSLYLWHWPIITLFHWTFGLESIYTILAASFFTVLLSWLSFKYVEQKFRKITISNNQLRVIGIGVIATVFSVIGLKFGFNELNKLSNDTYNPIAFQNVKVPKKAWPKSVTECHYRYYKDTEQEAIERCLGGIDRKKTAKTIYMLGDSHMQALYAMALSATKNTSITVKQIHNNSVPKILDGINSGLADIDYVIKKSKPGDLIVVSFYRGKFYDGWTQVPLDKDPMSELKVRERYQNSMQYFSIFANKLSRKKISLLLINDVPQMRNPVRIQQCLVQKKFGLPNACDVKAIQSLHSRKPMTSLFTELSDKYLNVYMWDPHSLVCPDEVCRFRDSRGFVMIDHNHISREMSEAMADEFRDYLNEYNLI